VRPRFLAYPEAYQLHRALALVLAPCGARGLHGVAPGFHFPAAFAHAALARADGSPAAMAQARALGIPPDCLWRWFVQGADGAANDFLLLRQAFASAFAAFAFFRVMAQAELPIAPSAMLFDDRRRLCIPNFLTAPRGAVGLPLTDQLAGMLPACVMRGTVAVTWHVLADTIARNADMIKVVLDAVLEPGARDVGNRLLGQAVKASTVVVGEMEPDADGFPFRLFEHLVETSGDAWRSRAHAFAWI
jgi:hypothetical protein